MKIGVICVGRDCVGVMDEVLNPWIQLMKEHNMHLCLISATFKEMEKLNIPAKPDEETVKKINAYTKHYPEHTSSFIFDGYTTEADVRDKGREILTSKNIKADVLWLLDMSDEYYTSNQIERIIKFVERYSLIAWFKLSLKNYVFNTNTSLKDPFQPPRIWRTYYGDKKLFKCTYDNDFTFIDANQNVITDRVLPNLTIPQNVAFIRHYTWLNDKRSKMKVDYQNLHFSHGFGCSFAWDDAQGGLIWNQEYFKNTKQAIPETVYEDNI